jgi:hypothetical protein
MIFPEKSFQVSPSTWRARFFETCEERGQSLAPRGGY